MTDTRFESIGAYLPEKRVSTRELMSKMTYEAPFDLQQITGIEHRRVHDKQKGEDSFAMAQRAAEDCLKRSKYSARDLDVIISASISRYKDGYNGYFEPSFALYLRKALGASNATYFDVSNACAGMMSGVYILDRMIKAGVVKNGMVVSGECITPIADTAVSEIKEPFDPQFGSLTVGDSAAAVIVDRAVDDQDKIHYIELMTCAEYAKLCIGMPSDERSGPALYTNNHEMHKEERVQLWPRFQNDFLKRIGTTFGSEKYDYIIQHQVGTKAIKNFSKYGQAVFQSEMPESLQVVEQLGNTATTSHFVVLYKHLQEKRLRKGAKFLLVPAASGLVTGCVSTTISSLEVA